MKAITTKCFTIWHALYEAKVFHGEADSFVPCDMSRRAFDVCASEKRLITVPNAEHGCGYLVEPERLSTALGEFFEENM